MKVQISHNPADGAFVDQLYDRLYAERIEAHRDYLKEARGGGDRLATKLRNYDLLIPVLSPAYLADEWLGKELKQGLLREQTLGHPFVVPVVNVPCILPAGLLDRPPIDFASLSFEDAFFQLKAYLDNPRHVFVVMQFGDKELDSMYEGVIAPTVEDFGMTALRIDRVEDSGEITEKILRHIERSVLVIADITGEKPNCYFEVGYALALGKEMILTVRQGERVHFNLNGHRRIEWSTEAELRSALVRRLSAMAELSKVHSIAT